MNEIEQRAILLIAETHKNMCVSVGTFVDFLKPEWNIYLQPITDSGVLRSGFYGRMLECKVWVSKTMAPNNISFSDSDVSNSLETEKWSPQISIKETEEYGRILDIKIFM